MWTPEVGMTVEVKSLEEGLRGAFFRAKVCVSTSHIQPMCCHAISTSVGLSAMSLWNNVETEHKNRRRVHSSMI